MSRSLFCRRSLRVGLLVTCFGFSGGVLSATPGTYYHVETPASTVSGELPIAVTYTLWIPQEVKTIRGIIVHQHGASMPAALAGESAAYDLHWQALAKKWDCALLGPSYHVLNDAVDLTPGGARWWSDPRHGSDQAFLRALHELGARSNHPEIDAAPWCLWGHSAGGSWANAMAILHPDRVIALFLRSGTLPIGSGSADFPAFEVPTAVYNIPTLTSAGDAEKTKGPWERSLATFHAYRAQGALVGFAPDPRTAHFCGDSRYLAIPFFDACLAARLPDQSGQPLKPLNAAAGWLAPLLGDTARPAREFNGNANDAVWLPDATVARAWMDYVKTGTVADITPPPSPYGVRATKRGYRDIEITWDADADFESGIGGFVVLRNGWAVGRVPSGPPDRVFGRPLFQGLSFHDTPEAPRPEMRFLDTTTKPGETYTYTVIELNSAGVASNPSAPATPY
jgi:poly(3-hydroxybutyrate) depolymerase